MNLKQIGTIGLIFLLAMVLLAFYNFAQFSPSTPGILESTRIAPTQEYVRDFEPPEVSIQVIRDPSEPYCIPESNCPDYLVSTDSPTTAVKGHDPYTLSTAFMVGARLYDSNGGQISLGLCDTRTQPNLRYCYTKRGTNQAVKVCVDVQKEFRSDYLRQISDQTWTICKNLP